MARDHRLVIQVIGDTRNAEKSLRKLKVEVAGFRRGIAQGLGFGAATVGVAGFGLAVKSAVQSFGDFEQSLQKMVGLSGVAQKSIKGLSQDVQQLAPVVGKGPQELADALFFITSSGIPASRALDVLTVSAKASAAGLGETQVVADAVTSALNAYGPAVLSATNATDVLVATVREGKGEADQFAGVIGNVAAIAAELGVSFDQVGAALAAQTRLGTDAETAATQLSQVFNAFLNTSPKVAKAFGSVGLNLDDLRRTLREQGLLAALSDVKKAFEGNVVGLRTAIPEIRAFRGVLALVGKQAGPVQGIFDRLAKSTGSLGTAFKAVSQTQAQQFARLNASLQVFKITVGAALAPAIQKVIGPLNEWLSKTENQKKVQEEIQKTVKGVIEVMQNLASVIRPLAGLARDVTSAVGGLGNAMKLLIGVLVVSKFRGVAAAITLIGDNALLSTGKVNGLRGSLTTLGATKLAPILIPLAFTQPDQVPSAGGGPGLTTVDDTSGLTKLAKAGKLSDATIDEMQRRGLISPATAAALHKAAGPGSTRRFHGSGGKPAAAKPLTTAVKAETPTVVKQATDTGKAAKKAFERALGGLEVLRERARGTTGLGDDLAVLKQQETVVRARLKVTKNDQALQLQLVQILNDQLDVQKQINEQRAAAKKSSQFKALGLTADGQERVASIDAIRKRAKSLTQEVKRSDLSPAKIAAFVKRISVVFTKKFDGAGRDIRQAILDMFGVINDALDSGSKKGPLTKTSGLNTKKILAGLGLSPDEQRALRGRLSSFNTAGRAPAGAQLAATGSFVVNTTVNLDGQKVAQNTTKHQQKGRRRNPQQKRGPNRKN